MTQDLEAYIHSTPWTPREFILLNKRHEAYPTESWISLVKLLTRRTSFSQEQILDMPIQEVRRVWNAVIEQLNSSPDMTEPLVTLEQAIAEVEQLFWENKKGGSYLGSNSSSDKGRDTTTDTSEDQDSTGGGFNKPTSDD